MYSWTEGVGCKPLYKALVLWKRNFKLIRKNKTGLFTFKWFDVRMEEAFICIKEANSTCY